MSPEQTKERARERHQRRWAESPQYRIYHRVKRWMRKHLRDERRSVKWSEHLGYSVAELHAHLERQFVGGMGWHNMGRWHIDHIVPVSSFTFRTPDDPEFRQAYALTNLRPVWARTNLRKGRRRIYLV